MPSLLTLHCCTELSTQDPSFFFITLEFFHGFFYFIHNLFLSLLCSLDMKNKINTPVDFSPHSPCMVITHLLILMFPRTVFWIIFKHRNEYINIIYLV